MSRFILSAMVVGLFAVTAANAAVIPEESTELQSSSDSTHQNTKRYDFALLSGTYHCLSKDVQYGKLASLGLFNLKVFPGYSTSIVRLNLYRANYISMPEGFEYYYVGTVPFLNGDFRIGGALSGFADAGIIFSYSYTPNCSKLRTFLKKNKIYHYVDRDYETFFGAELSARLCRMDAMVRFGYRLNSGNLNFYNSYERQYNSVPFDARGFIVSLELRILTSKAKGVNMIRVFSL